ncbi:hypothetical protein [Embleya sp. AB8]|uniref:hypothetical protein n=1 Tax=Embleya sp. AB8 TaxID=3156304 RepID=UPI003C70F186
MSKAKTRLAMTAIGGMLIAGGGGMFVFAPSAQAASTAVDVNMTCKFTGLTLPDATMDLSFKLELPAKVAPGQDAVIKVDMGKTVNSPVDLGAGMKFSVVMDASAAGASTGATKITGEDGKLPALVTGQPIILPPFNAKVPVPANAANGNLDLTLTHLTLTAGVNVECTPNASPKFATINVDKSAPTTSASPSTSTPPSDDPPGPPNGKEVNVDYACKTKVEDFPVEIPDSTATYGVTITVPSTAKKGDNLDISAKFKDNLVGKAPSSLPGENIDLAFVPTFAINVEQGSTKQPLVLTGPEKAIKVNANDPLTLDGPITGKFSVWGGGDFSFSPGDLKISTTATLGTLKAKSTTTCTVTKTAVSATLKAKGDAGTPPPTLTQSPTGNVGSNGGSSTTGGTTGDLAHTGASGGGMTAFAMAAGTAVLGAIALMLFVPYRRRIRNQV